jgi:hypothetical protein
MPLSQTQTIYDLYDYVENRFQLRFIEAGNELAEQRVTVFAENLDTICRIFDHMPVVPYRIGRTLAIEATDLLVLATSIGRTIDIKVMGEPGLVKTTVSVLSSSLETVSVRVKWVYNAKGESVRLPIRNDNLPTDSFYPALRAGGGLIPYYDRYMASDSNILVLIGPPGTGKTSFIRGLLSHAGSDAIISYDTGILSDDEIFADFMSETEQFMVLEDADTFLASRGKGGNTIMHKFLNVGDGLLSTKGKKIVFSTNLPSIRDIDEALLRPGRCFDILRFDKLSPDDARAIRPEFTGTEPVSLAELMVTDTENSSSRNPSRVGFV